MELDIPAGHGVWAGVGDVFSAAFPPNRVALSLHIFNKICFCATDFHRRINGVHQSKLPALPLGGGAVFPGGKTLRLATGVWLKGGQPILLTNSV